MDFQDLIYEIKLKNPIEEIVGEYIQLKKAGKSFKGLCPFHEEKTPSFHVSPQKNFYHCFGCKASGDVIKFIQEIEHISFMEAIELLAKKSNIDISEYRGTFNKSENDKIFMANNEAMKFYNQSLKYNKQAIEYLGNRGIDSRDINIFGLGYADFNNKLYKHIRAQKLNIDDFVKAGLIVKSNNNYRDYFAGRIIFPIFNHLNKCIGFGGRTLFDRGPKYLNSAENSVFKKGNFLYGLNLAKNAIYDFKQVIITEGYMDFISLYKAGIKNVVAQLGTACTQLQAKLISRMAEKAIIMYDGDKAGIDAAMRSIPILLSQGLAVDVFIYEECKDPDELIKNSKDKIIDFEFIKEHSIDFIDFIVKFYSNEKDNVLRNKHTLMYIKKCIDVINDNILREVYLKKIYEELNVRDSVFQKQINMDIKKRNINSKTIKGNIYLESISIMLVDDDYARVFCEELDDSEFSDIKTKSIFIDICSCVDERIAYNIDNIMKDVNIKNLKDYIIERSIYYEMHRPDKKKIEKIIHLIKRDSVKKKLEEIERKKLHTNDREERERLDEISILLKKKLKKGGL